MSQDITLAKAHLSIDNHLAVLTLADAAGMNVMGGQMGTDLKQLASIIAGDATVRAVLIRAEGAHFCGGGDLKEMQAGFSGDPQVFFATALADIHAALMTLHGLSVPIVSAVQGFAAGAGCNFALVADIVLVADTATFFEAFTQVGVAVDCGGSWLLPRAIGDKRALYYLLTGAKLKAGDAVAMGLASKVVPQENLEREARQLATQLAAGPTIAYAHIKRLVAEHHRKDLATALYDEQQAQVACAGTADFQTGVNAFLAKETPAFSGR